MEQTAAVRLVDSHCHLPLIKDEQLGLDGILARAQAAGVCHLLCVGVDLESWAGVVDCARGRDNISISVGVHPNSPRGEDEPSVSQLTQLATDHAVIAIGETGLDYFRSEGDLAWQHERFRVHIATARETAKPLIVHCRDAAADVIRVLREERAYEVGGVMHCFVDDWETASAALDLGFYISFSGIVTFNSARALQATALRLPLDRILVETDAPWLAPVPRRGQQNEPSYVQHTAAFIARLRDISLASFASATTRNFNTLFSLDV